MKNLIIIALLMMSAKAFSQAGSPPPPPGGVVSSSPEMQAEFPGGEDAMRKFIQKNLVYPDSARAHHVEGKVLVYFVVKDDGSLTGFKIQRSVSPDLDAEALRVAKLMPKFKPGSMGGMHVNVSYTLPVNFVLK